MKNERSAPLKKLISENKLAFAGLIAMVIWLPVQATIDINKVESGATQGVSVPFPVGTLYTYLGYWPAVLSYPLGLLALISYAVYLLVAPRKRPPDGEDMA